MKKPACVEFYKGLTLRINDQQDHYGWRLRSPKNGHIILTPGETFISHRHAVDSFRRVADASDMRAIFEVRDAEGVQGSHAMLIGK